MISAAAQSASPQDPGATPVATSDAGATSAAGTAAEAVAAGLCPSGIGENPAAPCIDRARRRIFAPKIEGDDAGRLTPSAKAVLNGVADLLAVHTEIAWVEIAAHDSLDENRYVDRTRRWARAVKDHLVTRGISPERLYPVSYGADRPIDTNKTPEGRARNRRIELVILPEQPR